MRLRLARNFLRHGWYVVRAARRFSDRWFSHLTDDRHPSSESLCGTKERLSPHRDVALYPGGPPSTETLCPIHDLDHSARNVCLVRPMDSDHFDRDVVHSPGFFRDRPLRATEPEKATGGLEFTAVLPQVFQLFTRPSCYFSIRSWFAGNEP